MTATLNDFVYLEEVNINDLPKHFQNRKAILIENIMKLLEGYGYVFRWVMFHMHDDRIPFIGILVPIQVTEKTQHVFPCEHKDQLVLVGSIFSVTEETVRVTIATDEPGKYLKAPKKHTDNYDKVLRALQQSDVQLKCVTGQWHTTKG